MSFRNSPFRFISPFLVQAATLPAPGLTSPAVTASRVAHEHNVLTSSAGSELLATMREVFYVVSIHIPNCADGARPAANRVGCPKQSPQFAFNNGASHISSGKPNVPVSKNSLAPTSRKALILIALLLK